MGPQEEVHFVLLIGARPRLIPPLADDYFGNAALVGRATMKAEELLQKGGFGKGASEINKVISSHSHEKVRSYYEYWVRTPRLFTIGSLANSNSLATSSSKVQRLRQ